MSRNKVRTQVPESKQPTNEPLPPPPAEKANPLGLSFVVPTEIIHLPSGGNFYPEGSVMQGVDRLEIKGLTAKEEDILINDSFIAQGIVFERLIDSIMITPGVKSSDLIDCDRVAILTAARRSGYGDTVEFQSQCDNCGGTYEAAASLTKMLERAETEKFQIKSSEEWIYDESSSTLSFDLPSTGLNVRIRVLSTEDFEFLKQSKAQKEKHNLPYSETIEFVRRALVSANDVVDPGVLAKLVEVLPAIDVRKIKYIHNINIPTFNTKQEFQCPHCSAIAEKEVPFSVGWFWTI